MKLVGIAEELLGVFPSWLVEKWDLNLHVKLHFGFIDDLIAAGEAGNSFQSLIPWQA